jgi:hypothetical protein
LPHIFSKQTQILLSVLIEDRPYDAQDYWNEMADEWKILAKSTAEEKLSNFATLLPK